MRKTIIASVGLLVLAVTAGARAQDIGTDLAGASHDAATAQARLHAIESQVAALHDELHGIEVSENRLIQAIANTEHAQQILWAELQDARTILAHRAAAAYQVGPAAALEIFLSVRSPSELASAQAFTERAFGSDTQLINLVQLRRREAQANAALLRAQRKNLDAQRARLEAVIGQIGERLVEARSIADAANLKVAILEQRRAELIAAAQREADRQNQLNHPGGGGSADWDAIAQCEAGGNWATNTGNGYWGGLQFAPSTWYSNGGGPFDGRGPFPYSRSQQIAVGERVLASQGPGAWPNCYHSR